MYEEYSELERGSSPSLTDRIERLVDLAFRAASFVFMPWRWFQNRDDDSQYYRNPRAKPGLAYQIQYPFFVIYDFFSSQLNRSLDWLEYASSAFLNRLTHRRRRKTAADDIVDNYEG